MKTIEEYKAQKQALEAQLEEVKKNIILTEQSIQQQETIFQTQFQTTDINELQKISEQYQASILEKEKELENLTLIEG